MFCKKEKFLFCRSYSRIGQFLEEHSEYSIRELLLALDPERVPFFLRKGIKIKKSWLVIMLSLMNFLRAGYMKMMKA